jgi:hypothetical protein
MHCQVFQAFLHQAAGAHKSNCNRTALIASDRMTRFSKYERHMHPKRLGSGLITPIQLLLHTVLIAITSGFPSTSATCIPKTPTPSGWGRAARRYATTRPGWVCCVFFGVDSAAGISGQHLGWQAHNPGLCANALARSQPQECTVRVHFMEWAQWYLPRIDPLPSDP